jgi:hypothetical protein
MTLYRRRPEDIRIHHVEDRAVARDWVNSMGGMSHVVVYRSGSVFLRFGEANTYAFVGDYIVREAPEDFRVYTPEEFNARYEEIGK